MPDELSRLSNLEHLQMVRNKLSNVHGELSDLPHLRSVIVRQNQIKTSGIPTDIFRMKVKIPKENDFSNLFYLGSYDHRL